MFLITISKYSRYIQLLIFKIFIYFDSGYLQPDTSYNKNSVKAIVLIVIFQKIGHYFYLSCSLLS